MDHTTETRRGLLRAATYAVGAGVVIAAAKITDAVGETPAADRAACDRAFAAMQRAKAAMDAHDEIYQRVRTAWEADAPSTDMINMSAFSYEHKEVVVHSLDVDKAEAAWRASIGRTWFGTEAAKTAQLAAFQSVRNYRAAAKAASDRHGLGVASEEYDRLGTVYCVALDELIEMPAPDVAALGWKLQFLMDTAEGDETPAWSGSYVAQTLADVDRLCGAEVRA